MTKANWSYELLVDDGSQFTITHHDSGQQAVVNWQHSGIHNVKNAMAAVAAAFEIGINVQQACDALSLFVGIKRRMETIYSEQNLTIYDDFAHHPTAIKTTLEGLRAKVGDAHIVAVIEPRSATMKLGVHQQALSSSIVDADQVLWYQNASLDLDLSAVAKDCAVAATVTEDIDNLLDDVVEAITAVQKLNKPMHIVIMSNGGFEGLHQLLLEKLS
jgi:UDP-N-acetylmuramate: L-alanyl-gamma-D-glutamyl-meso-diaminopimelate ligase